jgi:hypothetical protein
LNYLHLFASSFINDLLLSLEMYEYLSIYLNQKIIITQVMIETIFRINVSKTFDLYLSLLSQDLFLFLPLADAGVLQ